mgnify:CR=1 FL=1
MGQVGVVFRWHARHWNATVLGQIDRELFGQPFHLLLIETREAEHADLIGDVLPVVTRALFLQIVYERFSHRDDAIGHGFDLSQPQRSQIGRVKHFGGDLSAVTRRIRVHAADGHLQLAHDALAVLFVVHNKRDGANSFAIEAHVLGERLGDGQLVAVLNELAHRERVLVDVAAGEALIGRVKKREQLSLLLKELLYNLIPKIPV